MIEKSFAKKSITVLLILCLAMSTFVACGKNDTNSTSKNTEVTQDTETENKDTKLEDSDTKEPDIISQLFPPADLKGATIKVGFRHPNTKDVSESDKIKYTEATERVEKKYNCKLEFGGLDGIEWGEVPDKIVESVAAGKPIIDISNMSRYYISDLASKDAIIDITDNIKSFGMPEAYYKGGAEWNRNIIGFLDQPIRGFSCMAYNRQLIKESGMEKTPGEMFKEGKWSYDDFYNYCAELKTKLPNDVRVFGTHVLNWARNISHANGTSIYDVETNVPIYNRKDFYDGIELMQKMVANGLYENAPTRVNSETGKKSYAWEKVAQGFDEGKIAMIESADWDFENYASKFDYGIVPYPWGPNVTCEGDYTTISDNYHQSAHDVGVTVITKGADKKATIEQYMGIYFTYHQDLGELLVKNLERAENGEAMGFNGTGTRRNFMEDIDIELWDWLQARGEFEPLDSTVADGIFYQTLYRVCATNEDPRTGLEAIIVKDTCAMLDAGNIREEDLSPEMAEKVNAAMADYQKEKAEEEAAEAAKEAEEAAKE